MQKLRVSAELIGVLLAAITLAVTVAFGIKEGTRDHREITVSQLFSYDPLLCTGAEDILTINIFGQATKDLYLTFFKIRNTGNKAIRAEDFVTPITVSNRDEASVYGVVKSFALATHWDQVSAGAFQLSPLLVNPGEEFIVILATKQTGICSLKNDSRPNWQWNARIADAKLIVEGVPTDDQLSSFLGLSVQLTGWYIWLALVASVCFFYLSATLVRFFNWRWLRNWWILSGIFAAAVANGENVANIAESGLAHEWLVGAAFLSLHVLALIFGYSLIAVRKSRTNEKGAAAP